MIKYYNQTCVKILNTLNLKITIQHNTHNNNIPN